MEKNTTISDEQLIKEAQKVAVPRKLSPTAESGGVGCALVTDQGNIYVGVCIDLACQIGFCAERNAIGTMVTAGTESKIATIVAVNSTGTIYPPCGVCREFITEINHSNLNTRVLLSEGRVKKLSDLYSDVWFTLPAVCDEFK